LLQVIGEPDLITHSLAEQVARTAQLLTRPDELADVRARLPAKVRASPMADPTALGQEFLRVARQALDLPAGPAR
jgi:hypothetical protein